MMHLGWVYSSFFLRHDTGRTHCERPERLEAIVEAVSESGLKERLRPIDFDFADPEVIGWVHEPAYVELLRLACEDGMNLIGDDETRICRESYDVARLAVGGVLAACDAVMEGKVDRAFCALRPPGHHAERDHAMGYCLFNNIAIGAEYLVRRHGLSRVAIVDFDVHHGNGTEHLFETRDDVLFVSLHEEPESCYPGTGYEHDVGREAGEGFTLNVPLAPGSDGRKVRRVFIDKILPRLQAFAPQFVLLSAGFDAATDEPIANLNYRPDDYGRLTEQLAAVADEYAQGRMVSVLEGGYELGSLKRCVLAHLHALVQSG